jgi:1,2-diacylglycerol 3-beta-glucosyltransferase
MPRPAWLLLVPTVAYALGMGGVALALRRQRHRPPPPDDSLPPVGVLVAARDEEATLPRCLDALRAQDYPADRLTIYVADDHSTDGTAEVIRRYGAEGSQGPEVRAVAVPEPEGSLRGKALAIHAAVEASREPFLLVTDADCAPPPGWARALAGYLSEPGIGVACAPTHIDSEGASRLEAIQALDWAYLLSGCSALAESGRPVTAMGNNMALRREAYEAVGGYPALPFSVTEDYLLFKTILERTPWRARFPADPEAENRTLPLHSLREVYRQRRRWARGGLRARSWVYGVYGLTHLAHLLPLAALPLVPAATLGALALKLGADLAVLRAALPPDGRQPLRAFLWWEGYLFFYMVTLPGVIALFPEIRWKGRRL